MNLIVELDDLLIYIIFWILHANFKAVLYAPFVSFVPETVNEGAKERIYVTVESSRKTVFAFFTRFSLMIDYRSSVKWKICRGSREKKG